MEVKTHGRLGLEAHFRDQFGPSDAGGVIDMEAVFHLTGQMPGSEGCGMKYFVRLVGAWAILAAVSGMSAPSPAEIVEVKKIWDRAPHNAFTDLARFRGEWFCVFREGSRHVSPDGALRVITSRDGAEWSSAARLTAANADLRDAKITTTPDGRLMLTGAAALHPPAPARHQSLAWFSEDGRHWSEPLKVGETNQWLWRTTWHRGTAYSVSYDTAGKNFIRLYASQDGRDFQPLVPTLFDQGQPNEASLLFSADDSALCLLRRDGTPGSAQLGHARPPYTRWEWRDLGVKIGGPQLLHLPDGRIVVAARLYDGGMHTALLWLDPVAAKLTEIRKLPSGGDTSYAGLVWHEERLWVSYYSSHEGATSIYLAKVRLPAK